MANLGSMVFQVGADTSQLRKAESDVKRSAGVMSQSMISVATAAKLAFTAFAANEVRKFANEVVATGMKLQKTSLAFKAITGSAQGAADEMQFLRAESNRLGAGFLSTADAYKGIAAAAKGTSLEGKATRDVFTAITEAATVLGLTSEQTGRSLYALSQMISKGKVSSEELRQQLGENLPGAFNVAAEAMGMTTQQFDKMLGEGKIMTEDFLPKFSAAMKEKFGRGVADSAKSAQAETNRLSNAFIQLQDAVWKKGEPFYTSFLIWMTETVNRSSDLINSMGDAGSEVNRFGKTTDEVRSKASETFESMTKDLEKFSADMAAKTTEWSSYLDKAQNKVKDLGSEILNLPEVKKIVIQVYEEWFGTEKPLTVPKGRQQLYASRRSRTQAEEIAKGREGLSPYQIDPEMARLQGQRASGKWDAIDEEAARKIVSKDVERMRTPLQKAMASIASSKAAWESQGIPTAEISKMIQSKWDELYKTGVYAPTGGKGASKDEVWDSWNKSMMEGQDILRSTYTDTEKYNEELDRLKWYLDYGAISQETYAKAVQNTWNELVKANEATEGWTGHLKVLADAKSVFDSTRTDAEKYAAEIDRLNYLLAYGAITQDTYNRAVKDAGDKFKATSDKMSEFAIQAARNIESSLGDTLYNVLTGNFDNIGVSFGELMAKMVAQAAAAQMSIGLFGNFGQTKEIGGLVGSLFSSVGGWFSGGGATLGPMASYGISGRAEGGPVTRRTSYIVGERGPELFTPGVSGRITPIEASGGSNQPMSVQIINRTTAEVAKATPRFDSKAMILSVVLEGVNRDQNFKAGIKRGVNS